MVTVAARQVEPDQALKRVGNVLVVVWRGDPDLGKAQRTIEHLDKLVEAYPENCALLQVIEAGSGTPTSEVRGVTKQALRRIGTKLSCLATVMLGTSGRASLVRLVMSGLASFGSCQETEFFSDIPTAIKWCAKLVPAGLPPNLHDEVEKLRKASA